MAYGDKKIFYNLFFFIIEKFDFLVEMPPEKEVLGFFSEGQIVRISLSLIPNAPWVLESFPGGYQMLITHYFSMDLDSFATIVK